VAEFYTCVKDHIGRYDIKKFQEDTIHPESEYYVEEMRGGQFICNCPASGRHPICRHIHIFERFRKEGKINKGYFYDFKNETFSQLFGVSDDTI